MKALSQLIDRFPIAAYFFLAYAFAWILYPLIAISPLAGLPGLFAPALAAIIVCWALGGRAMAGKLLNSLALWRVSIVWYLIALGLPVLLTFIVGVLARLMGHDTSIQLAPITPLALIVFVLVVGEEIGWRGFAQPQLEKRFSPLVGAVILGIVWGFWHLPNFFLPELPHYQIPLPAFVLYTTGFSVVGAWLLKATRGSVLIATLFHGAVNTFGFLTPSLDSATRWWLLAAVYCAAALVIAVIYGGQLSRKRSADSSEQMAEALVRQTEP